MTDEASTVPRRSRWRWLGYAVAVALVVVAALIGSLAWYVSTPQFSVRVHHAVVRRLERATGGRVEMGQFHWSARTLTIEIDDLTIHGKEAPGEIPYFHVRHLTLGASVLSFLSPKIRLTSIAAEGPTVHLIVASDGTTNQPQPRAAGNRSLSRTLLNMAVEQTRVENGLLLVNDRKVPFELAAGPLALTIRYLSNQKAYQAYLDTKNIAFRLKKSPETHSRLQVALRMTRNSIKIDSLRLQTGNSRMVATGELRDFAAPIWKATAWGSVDAREIGAMTGVDGLRDGRAQVSLNATGSADGKFLISGRIDLQNGEWMEPWLRLRDVDLRTNLSIDNDTCSFTDFSSVLEDQGKISGSMVLKHCIGPSRSAGSTVVKLASPPLNAGHGRLSPRALLERLHRRFAKKKPRHIERTYQPMQAEIAAQVSDVTLPLILKATAPSEDWNIGFTTAASGKVTVRWTGDGDGLDVHGDLMLSVPRRTLG
ncbi:MAG: hypothetical protein ACRD28_02205, partial [Acidobacteriaceae bacterium]